MNVATVAGLPPEARGPATELLLALADDEFLRGHRLSEWVARGPTMEEDNALASISQDEFGHARLFYEAVADELGSDLDALALNRAAAERRNTRLVEAPQSDFADTVAVNYLYDAAERLVLEALADGEAGAIADYAAQALREEPFHREHADVWLDRLVATAEGRKRLGRAFADAIPRAADYFAFEPATVDPLVDAGVLARPLAPLRGAWAATVRERLAGLPLDLETALDDLEAPPDANGRAGEHTGALKSTIDEMHPRDLVGDYPVAAYER